MYQKLNLNNDFYNNEITRIISKEYENINSYANLIGSANYAFPSVLEVLNTPFNLNPAEGSIGERYFPLCDGIDDLEIFGEQKLRELFNIDNEYSINLEPYSGTQANQIVYNSILEKNDTVVAMNSRCGGHVSHHHFLKKYFNLIEYGIDENEIINYKQIEEICKNYHPKLLVAGCSSYPRQIDYVALGKICKKYNVKLLADISHTVIYIINKNHISPFGVADFVTFTTHKTTRGIRGGIVIYKSEYKKIINKSVFPFMQGAPKFNEILAKVVMIDELLHTDINSYVNDILKITNTFVNHFNNNNLKLYTGGSDSHIITIDLTDNNLTGKQCEELLKQQHILVNRNSLPYDKLGPSITSGIRIGTLSLATLKMDVNDYCKILDVITLTILQKQIIDNNLVESIVKKYSIINISNEEIQP